MDYTMISRIYVEVVPVKVIESVINLGYDYLVAIGGTTEFSLMELSIDGNGNVKSAFLDRKGVRYVALYSGLHHILNVTIGGVRTDTVKVEVGNFVFNTVSAALGTHRALRPSNMAKTPISPKDLKDYMIPTRVVTKMLDTLTTDIDIWAVSGIETLALTKSVKNDDAYAFIEEHACGNRTNVYTYTVGEHVFCSPHNAGNFNDPEQWIHIDVVKRMLYDFKEMLEIEAEETEDDAVESAKNLTVNVNVTVE